MKALRHLVAACAVALMAMSVSGIRVGHAQDQAKAVEVKVGVIDSLAEAVTFIAMDRGYFRDEGLDVKLISFSNTADMVAPLSSGELDVASGAPTLGLFNGALRGLPFKLVADKGRNSPGHGYNAIVVRKDLIDSGKVKTIADLKGLKVATPSRHSPMELQLEIALKTVNLTLADVSLEQLTFPNMTGAFASKVIDAGMMIEPFVGSAVKRGLAVRFMGADDIQPNFQMAGVIYGPDFPAKKPDAAKRWVVGYLRGIRDYLKMTETAEGKLQLGTILAKYTKVFKDPSLMNSVVSPGFDPDGYLNLQTIQESIDWYFDQGLLKAKPNVKDLVDYQYLDYAVGRLGKAEKRETVN